MEIHIEASDKLNFNGKRVMTCLLADGLYAFYLDCACNNNTKCETIILKFLVPKLPVNPKPIFTLIRQLVFILAHDFNIENEITDNILLISFGSVLALPCVNAEITSP